MEKNLAVVYTEYQLLQVEAIITHYKLKNVMLIIHNTNNRIPDWVIDHTLFENIIQLPLEERSQSYRLTRKYIQYYSSLVADLLKGLKIHTFIGAQDENTIFAIIKHHARPTYYWNIEDGNANYLRENFRYRLELFVKKVLFFTYGYGHLDIRYGHGLVKADKTFRLYPKLSVDKKECINLAGILSVYLKDKVEKIRSKVTWVDEYTRFDTLVVYNFPDNIDPRRAKRPNELYKFHPINTQKPEGVSYIRQHIAIEFLPYLLPNIKTIRYAIYSSSILNMLVLDFDVDIQLDYTPPNKAYTYYTNNVVQEFQHRLALKPC